MQIIPTITIQASKKTNDNETFVVAEMLSIIVPESPTVTEPTLVEFERFLTIIGELTVMRAFSACSG